MPKKPIVLVVEDDPLLRTAAVAMMEGEGFVALEAGNASQAISILEQRDDICVVFSDIDMPPGLSGIELMACIRSRWPPIHLVLTSGFRAPNAAELPADCLFFSKPYEPGAVVDALHRWVS